MARGSIALMRGPRELFTKEYPGLAELADFISWFGSPAQLVATLRGLISHHESAAEKARLVARRIRADHTITIRVQTLVRHVRASRTNPSAGND
jgi:spore maturation protein CgeB